MTTLGKLVGAALLAALSTSTLVTTAASPASAQPAPGESPARVQGAGEPLVIGHRGASGYRPEHTLASYRLAIRMGADYVEPDLVSTKDHVLVARHENDITGTTNVAQHPEFAGRKTTKTIDGKAITGWFTEDFTLAELKSLRAKERLPQVRPDNTRYDGQFQVPTFDEVLDLVQRESNRGAKQIGVYPETKHPTYFDSIGLSLEEPLVDALKRHGLDRAGAHVFLQSFETGNLRDLARMTDLPLIRLTSTPFSKAQLRDLATFADGIGPDKELVLPRDASGRTGAPSALVRDAHAEGLQVHVFTLRRENQFMAVNFRKGTDPNAVGDLAAEAKAFFDAGVDGVFTDNSDLVVQARRSWLHDQRRAA